MGIRRPICVPAGHPRTSPRISLTSLTRGFLVASEMVASEMARGLAVVAAAIALGDVMSLPASELDDDRRAGYVTGLAERLLPFITNVIDEG